MTLPALASLLIALMPWRPMVALFGACGFIAAIAIFALTPRFGAEAGIPAQNENVAPLRVAPRFSYPILVAIGAIDSATRMGFLLFLPFLLTVKGASLQTVGLALTLVFAGGAAGKLVCAFIGARIGVFATVLLTETFTALGILALLPLPLAAGLVLLPIIGIALNGTSSVLYGSVPVLVAPQNRARAFSIFYTGTIGTGAIAPILYGLVGDVLGVVTTLTVIAGIVLFTLPLAWTLRPALAAQH